MDENMIYLCECGRFKHRADAVFCSSCGRRINPQRDDALAVEIESLLRRWVIARNGASTHQNTAAMSISRCSNFAAGLDGALPSGIGRGTS